MTSQTRRLLNADFSDVQADAIDDSITDATRDLATKADVLAVQADVLAVRADLSAVRADVSDVRADVSATRADLYRAMLLLGLGIVTINAAMVSAAVAVIQLT